MTGEQVLIFAILGLTLAMFAWGRLRYDLVAVAVLMILVLTGEVAPASAFMGFAHPAVITVAAVLVISRALRHSGVVDVLAQRLVPFTGTPSLHVGVLTALVTAISAFMNNVGALALLMPVALDTAARRKRPASLLLMPLAFGSLVGGMITLIGTPPNIIIAEYRDGLTGHPFGLFDFAPVGLGIAVAAVVFIALVGWRLVPAGRSGSTAPEKLFQIGHYTAEIRVPPDSASIGLTIDRVERAGNGEVITAGLIRGGERVVAPGGWRRLKAEDLLIVRADPVVLKTLIETTGLELVSDSNMSVENLRSDDISLVEAVVTPDSPLMGRTPASLAHGAGAGAGIKLLALAQRGEAVTRRLNETRFHPGDILLLQTARESLPETMAELGLLPLAERELRLPKARRILPALALFAGAVALAGSGLTSLPVAFVLAILAYVVLDILPLRELYLSIDWPVIVLLGALMPLGGAMERSGAAALLAKGAVALTWGLTPAALVAALMVVSMGISNIVNNAATALLMAPIGASLAAQLGVSPDPMLMAVAVGSSAAFLTPIGHQSNMLVMGPGGYRFGDFWRMGLPLQVICAVIGTPLILWIWPL